MMQAAPESPVLLLGLKCSKPPQASTHQPGSSFLAPWGPSRWWEGSWAQGCRTRCHSGRDHPCWGSACNQRAHRVSGASPGQPALEIFCGSSATMPDPCHYAQAVQVSFLHHPLASASVGSGSETQEFSFITFLSCLWNSTALLAPPGAFSDFFCPRQTPATWGIQAPEAVPSQLHLTGAGFAVPMALVTFRQERLLSPRLPMPEWLPVSRAWVSHQHIAAAALLENGNTSTVASPPLCFLCLGRQSPFGLKVAQRSKKPVLKHFHR